MPRSRYEEMSDRELILLCLQQDAQAWESLIGRYNRLIYSVALKMGLSQADATDVFQDVCLILFQKLADLRDERRLASWLITVTVRESLRAKRMQASEAKTSGAGQYGGRPDEALLKLEQQDLLMRALEKLDKRCRTLIEMIFFSEKAPSHDQIAAALGIARRSVGNTRARCLEKLRKIYNRLSSS